ncbi:GGDEF domain-containing protein [Luteimonas yindakuii]|uniref:diguanylate cyclase n=1 Tax=Luteimonas yindakuii TaxID=2565782 RepID=A0A4Z1R5Q9_9GAMM|nr:diguanylate cyclase [Luteimonas yindakuii]TKS53875.1 GGDEF domain-containing protein [Luteimonas yindakuii]
MALGPVWLLHGRALLLALLALSCLLPAPTCAAAPSAPALIDAATTRASLAPHLQLLHDTAGDIEPGEALRLARAGGFEPLPDGRTALGFQPGAHWFHAIVVNRNARERDWLLVQEYPLSDRLDLYVVHADRTTLHHAGGDHLPFASRAVRDRHPNFRISLPVGEPVELLLRIESQSSLQVPLVLYTPVAYAGHARDSLLVIGLYYGIILALFVYNLVLWLSLRDASYFWYLFHICAFGLVLFTLNGFGFEYLWPDSPWLADRAVPMSICLALVAMQQFARHFLELPRRWSLGNAISLGMIGFFIAFGIASIWLPYRTATPVASGAVLVGVAWILLATIHVVRQGYAPAKLLLLAWLAFLAGTAAFTLLAFGLLPKNLATGYGVQIGSALEMLLLSVALGYRYASLRNENERIVAEATARLEGKVAQRTQELRGALTQLEEAHARLRDSSRRDGLTGLYNRTWFREEFAVLVRHAADEQRPLAVLMIDLDHFKAINDRHGHLGGDECLRIAARRIGRVLRQHDALLARFGGEEFVAALPGHDAAAATAVGHAVCTALASTPCLFESREIMLSASIGIHAGVPDNQGVDGLLAAADSALYVAKAQGRGCVRMSPASAAPIA